MSIYTSIYELLSQGKSVIKGDSIYFNYNRLKMEQYLDAEKVKKLQLFRASLLLKHAQLNSKFYKERFANENLIFGQENDLEYNQFVKIPPLTRDNLQSETNNILTTDTSIGLYRNSSGGSTGKPVNFYQDNRYALASEYHKIFYLGWMQVRRGDKTAIFWGADRDINDWPWKEKLRSKLRREKLCNSFSMDDERIRNFISMLNKFKPAYIYGYASSLYLVAQKIKTLGIDVKFIPKAISSSAEMLYDSQRNLIESVFGAKVYNFYGSREVNNIAVECECHEGLHVNSSSRIVEILDNDNNVVPNGTVGHVAVTDLTNYAFPFVRYLNGDMATLIEEQCECGRTLPRLESIYGRSSDFFLCNGQLIHGEYFTHIFYNKPEVNNFQLVQESENLINLFIVPNGPESVLKKDEYRKIIVDKVGQGIEINIKVVQKIDLSSTGKYRFTISKIKM